MYRLHPDHGHLQKFFQQGNIDIPLIIFKLLMMQ